MVRKRKVNKWLGTLAAVAAMVVAVADMGFLGAAAQRNAGQVLDALPLPVE